MKEAIKILFLTPWMLFFSFGVMAQEIKVSEPEWEGDIVYVNEPTGKGVGLERQLAAVKTKANAAMHATGMGKYITVMTVKGEKSPVRVKKNSTIQFVYKFKSNDKNPRDIIQILKTVSEKGSRSVEIASSGTFSGTSSGDVNLLTFEAVKYGTSSYLITLRDLPAGEYGFSLGDTPSLNVYCFGVDE